MAFNYQKCAEQILRYVGGRDNIANVSYSADGNYLSLVLVDSRRIGALTPIEGVRSRTNNNGRCQFTLDSGYAAILFATIEALRASTGSDAYASNARTSNARTGNNVYTSNAGTTGGMAGGVSLGNYHTVNKLYDEEKFHARQGHGFAAEQANTLYDKLTGHDARVVGDDFSKNGADRIVDGVQIQSKCCATGSRCINECFEDGGKGGFRYYTSNGKPMQIEVPSDKYDAAVQAMEEKIRRGQVKGVTDPKEAKNIVRKGHFTYEQVKNIAKAGTVESLTYDAVNGVITAGSAFGVTAAITFAVSIWNDEDFDIALKNAAYSGLKVGGMAFATSVIASQLSKAGLNSALVGSSEAIVSIMGPKASAMLVNAFRSGSNIYGAAAMKSAAKLLRGNVITSGITVALLSAVDVTDIFRGRISGEQLFKNMLNNASTVVGGSGGWLGGAAIGSAILPGVGTVIGGFLGATLGGTVAGKTSNAVLSTFIEDDAEAMVRVIEKVFGELATDYLLNRAEAKRISERLKSKLTGSILKDMYAHSDRTEYARTLLVPLMDDEVSKRKKVYLPSTAQMAQGLREVLEDMALYNADGEVISEYDTLDNDDKKIIAEYRCGTIVKIKCPSCGRRFGVSSQIGYNLASSVICSSCGSSIDLSTARALVEEAVYS